MSEFAAAFREHATPRLRVLCIAHGSSIAHGLENFTQAQAAVMRAAIALGASHLRQDFFDQLEDHLLTTLSNSAWETVLKLEKLK